MRKAAPFLGAVLIALWLLAGPAQAAEYSEVYHSGKIDWYRGTADGVGVAMIPKSAAKSGRRKAKVVAEAEDSARRSLFELIRKVRVESGISIHDLMKQSEGLGREIQELVRKNPVTRVRERRDSAVEAVIRMDLKGALSELVLPKDIQVIGSVLQPRMPLEKEEKAFTGLVVDCTGMRVKPAMAPKIFDEDGQMVYGPPFISREHAVKERVALYSKDLTASKKEGRVASRPLTVRGIRTASTGLADIVISNADAARIRGSASNLMLLQKCRVIVLLD